MATYIIVFIFSIYEVLNNNHSFIIVGLFAGFMFFFELGQSSNDLKFKRMTSLLGKIIAGLFLLLLVVGYVIKELPQIKNGDGVVVLYLLPIVLIPLAIMLIILSKKNKNQ
jgi:hypothetical protein